MLRRVRRALVSVSDKSGLVDLARALAGFGVELPMQWGGGEGRVASAGKACGLGCGEAEVGRRQRVGSAQE